MSDGGLDGSLRRSHNALCVSSILLSFVSTGGHEFVFISFFTSADGDGCSGEIIGVEDGDILGIACDGVMSGAGCIFLRLIES